MSRRRRIFKRLFLGGCLAFLLGAATLFWAWRDGRLVTWAENWLVRQYLREIAPQLPFKVVSVDVDSTWADFKQGRMHRFTITIERDPGRLILEGPMEIRPQDTERGREYAVFFESKKTLLEWRTARGWKTSPTFALVFWAQANPSFTRLSEMGMKLSAPRLELLPYFTTIQDAQLRAEWDVSSGSMIRAKLTAPVIRYHQNDVHTAELKGLALTAEHPISFFPFVVGDRLGVKIQADHFEGLYDPYYIDTGLDDIPIQVETALANARPTAVVFSVGRPRQGIAQVSVAPHYAAGDSLIPRLEKTDVRIDLKRVPFAPFFQLVRSFPELAVAGDAEFTSGRLDFSLSGSVPFDEKGEPLPPFNARRMLNPWLESWEGWLQLSNVSALWKSQALAVQGVHLRYPFRLRDGGEDGSIRVERVAFRRWEGQIPQHTWSLTRNREAAREVIKFELPDGLVIAQKRDLAPKIAETTFKFRPGEEDLFEVKTGLEIPKSPLEPWIQALCIPIDPVPPADVEVALHRVVVYPDAIEPRGSVRVRAFGGELELTDVGIYEWLTPRPEADFSVRFGGFELGQLGPWMGFGKMEGTLEGYANNVTVVKTQDGPAVPTHYDFRVELKPTRGKQVVFSPQAMRNFVAMVAGPETLDAVPGIGKWFFFGLPREMLGGYGVKYAGLTAFATDGSILVETLDPPGSKDHYVLRSASSIFDVDTFTVRLASKTYPVVLDAEGMRGWLQNIFSVVENLSQIRKAEAAAGQQAAGYPAGEKVDRPCLPKEFDEARPSKAD